MIRVFLVDDHTVVRMGLRRLLDAQPDLQIVGEAGNGLDLLAQLRSQPADVVVLDVSMPGMDGPETARRLRTQYPAIQVLALSMMAQEQYILQMMDAGAKGYVLKSSAHSELLAGIRAVAVRQFYLCTAAGLAALYKARGIPEVVVSQPSSISKREKEILQLICDGLTTNEISDKLFIGKRTTETHRQNLLEKTGTKNTATLVRFAVSEGLAS